MSTARTSYETTPPGSETASDYLASMGPRLKELKDAHERTMWRQLPEAATLGRPATAEVVALTNGDAGLPPSIEPHQNAAKPTPGELA